MPGPELAKAVVKTMKILECLSCESSFRITDLVKRISDTNHDLRMNKSTVYRFLSSLKELDFVRQDPETERYSLTLRLFEIGMSVLERTEIWREAQPIIKRVAQQTEETVHLAALENKSLVYLIKMESAKNLRVSMMSRVGQNAPTYCTGLGKILLAYLPPARVKEILKTEKMVRYTDRTITRRADLTRELAAIRERGYAMDNEEHELGVRCLAAPVYDNCDNVCAAISIAMPSVRLTDDEIPRYREIVMAAGAEISRRLGYQGEVQVTSAEPG